MKTTVIYHRSDFDGLFCREIARKFLSDATFIGWDYGDPPIPVPEGKVYVLDLSPYCLSFDLDKEKGMTFPADWIVWIDHHKSAIDKYSATIPGYRIDGVAACRLAWQWFMRGYSENQEMAYVNNLSGDLPAKEDFVSRNVREPLAVRLAGEYDIWDKRDPEAELFQHGLRGQELLPGHWNDLLGMGRAAEQLVEHLLCLGRPIAFVRDNEYREVIQSQGFDIAFEGFIFLACCSHELDIRSQLFAAGIQDHHHALLGFTYTGHDWRVSMYHAPNNEHIDLSKIAVKYGGGGHRGACGFRMKQTPPWLYAPPQ